MRRSGLQRSAAGSPGLRRSGRSRRGRCRRAVREPVGRHHEPGARRAPIAQGRASPQPGAGDADMQRGSANWYLRFGCELRRPGCTRSARGAAPRRAGPGSISFLANPHIDATSPTRRRRPSCSTQASAGLARPRCWWLAIPTPPTRGSRTSSSRRWWAGATRARAWSRSIRRRGSGPVDPSRAARASAAREDVRARGRSCSRTSRWRRHRAGRARHALPGRAYRGALHTAAGQTSAADDSATHPILTGTSRRPLGRC